MVDRRSEKRKAKNRTVTTINEIKKLDRTYCVKYNMTKDIVSSSGGDSK